MRKTLFFTFLLGALAGGALVSWFAWQSSVSAQSNGQTLLGPGLYVFQNRLTAATCDDISGSGYVNSYVAEIAGIPGHVELSMGLPNSSYWPNWALHVRPDGHVIGQSRMHGMTGPDRGEAHFDVTQNGDQFTGLGARSYVSTVNGQRRRCTVTFDALLRRIDR